MRTQDEQQQQQQKTRTNHHELWITFRWCRLRFGQMKLSTSKSFIIFHSQSDEWDFRQVAKSCFIQQIVLDFVCACVCIVGRYFDSSKMDSGCLYVRNIKMVELFDLCAHFLMKRCEHVIATSQHHTNGSHSKYTGCHETHRFEAPILYAKTKASENWIWCQEIVLDGEWENQWIDVIGQTNRQLPFFNTRNLGTKDVLK